jgi:transcriptional/translational regulatory protein YebC/TACO1
MSGHNKWSKIKRKKEAADQERSKIYSKHSKAIMSAAKNNPNPETNLQLKQLIEQAEKDNLPKENIKKLLERAQDKTQNTENIEMEAYGPEGIAIIIIAETDNSNRTIQQIKTILNNDSSGKWADPGSVKWAFDKNENNEWIAKFPQKISSENKNKLDNLIEKIKENEDVEEVFTSAS